MAILKGTAARRNAWIQWLDHCPGRNGAWSNPTFFGKTIGGVPTPAVGAYRALEIALGATGYVPKSRWAYNFRGISGAICTCAIYGKCSLHSNGIAVDIDPTQNPLISTSTFRWSDTDFTPTQIAAVKAIKNTKGEQIWDWGGWWNTIKDYMHFELQVVPTACEVDWDTVKGYTEGLVGEDQMFDQSTPGPSPAVAMYQRDLITLGYDLGTFKPIQDKLYPPGADGWFRTTAEAVTKVFQKNLGLAVTGKGDALTVGTAANLARYSERGSSSGVTTAVLNSAIATHAKAKPSSTIHPHSHDEGQTGPAI